MEDWIRLFGIKFYISRVAFKIFGLNIYWYGIIIALGFALAVLYGFKRAKDFDIDPDRLIDVVLVTTPVSIIFARLYYCVFFGVPITQFFSIRNGGLAILGSVIGAVLAGAIMCRVRKVNILDALDLASMGFLIGQGIGRWGNFVNQEAYGGTVKSDFPFGMTGSIIGDTPVHPCFLYESVWCLLGFLLLHILSKHRKFKGQLATTYMIWYGFGRFFIEGLRTDSLYLIGHIRVSQLLSALMFAAGIVIYIVVFKRKKQLVGENNYVSVFAEENETENAEINNEEQELDIIEKDSTETDNTENTEGGKQEDGNDN